MGNRQRRDAGAFFSNDGRISCIGGKTLEIVREAELVLLLVGAIQMGYNQPIQPILNLIAIVLVGLFAAGWYRRLKSELKEAINSMKIAPVQTSIGCPWQNGAAEHWVGSCRRGLIDHVVVLDERHLKRLVSDYISYYHDDRTHLGLSKDAGQSRANRAGAVG